MKPQPEMNAQELRKFGLTTSLIVVCIFGLLLPWMFGRAFTLWPWLIAGVLSLFALLSPERLRSVYKYWMIFGSKLGWLNTRIILGVTFFLMFVPIGLGMRLFGYDPLTRKKNKALQSYRTEKEEKEPEGIAERMEKPY